MNASEFVPLKYGRIVEESQDMWLCVFDVSYGSKSKIFIHKLFNDRISFAQSDVHLYGSLAVTEIVDCLLGYFIDVLEHCWEVIVCHMLESELPKLFAFVRVEFSVISGVLVSSGVTQPNIIAFIGQHEARGFVLVIDNPSIWAI